MYTRNVGRIALPITLVLAFSTIAPLAAQTETEGAETPEVLLSFSSTAFKRKLARTQNLPTNFTTANVWTDLPGATHTVFVSAFDSDLFNVSFSAECAKFNGGVVRIRVLDNGVLMNPQDNDQVFCSSSGRATYKGNWVRRTPAVSVGLNHTVRVQFLVAPAFATIDDWTFELLVYN